MTKEEADKLNGGIVPDFTHEPVYIEETNLPKWVNWDKKGAVNVIQNQKKCGNCWAFGTTPTLEASHW